MLQEALKYLGFGTPFALAAAIYGFFHLMDKKASGKAKLAVSTWFDSPKQYDRARVADALVEAFDRIYGQPLLRLRSLLRSALITIVVTTIVLVGHPGIYGLLFAITEAVKPEYFWEVSLEVAKVVFFAFLLNILSDYLSLFAVRFSLVRIVSRPFLALVIAPLAGAVIIAGVFYLQFWAMGGRISSKLAISADWQAFVQTNTNIYAALIVHLWLPLFALGVVFVQLVGSTKWAAANMQWFLKQGHQHPFDALGYVAGMIAFIVASAFQFAAWATHTS